MIELFVEFRYLGAVASPVGFRACELQLLVSLDHSTRLIDLVLSHHIFPRLHRLSIVAVFHLARRRGDGDYLIHTFLNTNVEHSGERGFLHGMPCSFFI